MFLIPDDVEFGQFGVVRYQRDKYTNLLKPIFIDWFPCRDSFQYAFYRQHHTSFFYACNQSNTAAFVKCAEKSLGLWLRTKLYASHTSKVCEVYPARFWLKQRMRMSFFTILLRASARYTPQQDWRECLMESPYVQATQDAVAHFFAGHTVYKGLYDGWCNQFTQNALHTLHRPRLSQFWKEMWKKS